ncbi:MAG: hypothetical protein KZQ70_10745, partial [gamma proteobacterium symbiont of Lucinoma myriamae]|nr:hypothetical protein [gamma proteobacterium symbiont of Lucinoma myriamae]
LQPREKQFNYEKFGAGYYVVAWATAFFRIIYRFMMIIFFQGRLINDLNWHNYYLLQNPDKQKGFICDFPAYSSYNHEIILSISF